MTIIKNSVRSIAQILIPTDCVLCSVPVASTERRLQADERAGTTTAAWLLESARKAGVCSSCLDCLLAEALDELIIPATPPRVAPRCRGRRPAQPIEGGTARCRGCSRPLISEYEWCCTCRSASFSFAGACALFEYRGRARKLLGFYKFENYKPLAVLFAALLCIAYVARFGPAPIVPVPAQRRSRAHRGWDQVGVLAGHLSNSYGVPVITALRRSPGDSSQKTLGRTDRFSRASSHYQLAGQARRGGCRGLPTAVLVDDVLTTGATASACAELLRSAGVEAVQVLALTVR